MTNLKRFLTEFILLTTILMVAMLLGIFLAGLATSAQDPRNSTNQSFSMQGTTGSIGGSLLALGSCASGTATVSGAVSGMTATAQESDGSFVGGSFTVRAIITSSNTVTVEVCAAAAGTPTAKTYNVRVVY